MVSERGQRCWGIECQPNPPKRTKLQINDTSLVASLLLTSLSQIFLYLWGPFYFMLSNRKNVFLSCESSITLSRKFRITVDFVHNNWVITFWPTDFQTACTRDVHGDNQTSSSSYSSIVYWMDGFLPFWRRRADFFALGGRLALRGQLVLTSAPVAPHLFWLQDLMASNHAFMYTTTG